VSSVEFRHLAVKYGRRAVIHDFSMAVASGSWVGLIGPNGAGKSSLLRAVAGLVKYSGDIVVDGSSLSLRSRSRRASLVAYVPQEPILPDEMTGREYVMLGRTPHIGYFGQWSMT
jgi:iron complex transport system ATP-binding protein